MAPKWIHCNLCLKVSHRSSTPLRLMMTSCGKVVCETCVPKLGQQLCNSCQGPCNKIIPLSRSAPKDVQDFFSDPIEQLKKVFKILSFQENQKANLIEGTRELGRRKEYEKKQRLSRLEELNSRLERTGEALNELVKQETLLKDELNRLTMLGGTNRRSSRGSDHIKRDLMRSPEFSGKGVPVSRHNDWMNMSRSSGGSRGSGERGREREESMRPKQFLQLKTPAAWKTYQQGTINEEAAGKRYPSPVMEMMRPRNTQKPSLPMSSMFTSPPVYPNLH